MTKLTTFELKAPYLIFIGDTDARTYAKTGAGIIEWRPELVAGQLRFAGNDLDLGVADLTLEEAVAAGVKSIVVGVAPVGGVIGERWISVLEDAALKGLDVVSGLHLRLEDFPALRAAAEKSGASLINVRTPAENIPVGTGARRTGRRVLMVGTDCAVGKKYSALALAKALIENGINASFRATGQTGIMIAGMGVPIDAVVADFISGAAEMVSPANDPGHWDVIEGQGSLFNPSYSGVSLGLLHGSQPDALVVCHDPAREYVSSAPHMKMPTVADCIDLHLRCARLVNADVICIGVSVNTSGLPEGEREPYLQALSEEVGLPCLDPLAGGCGPFVDAIKEKF